MNWLMIVLRVIHIAGGVFWAGAVFVNEGFLLPTVKALGPVGGQFMRHLVGVRKYSIRIATAGFLVILSGLGMYWRNGSISAGSWYRSRQAMVYGIGGLAAIIALVFGLTYILRAAGKITEIGNAVQASGGPPSAEQAAIMGAMQKRMSTGSHVVAGLIGITVIAMAIGRYV
jgi:hypothetical protein